MTAPISVTTDYTSRKSEIRKSLNSALAKRESILGFVLGLIGVLAVIASGFAFLAEHYGFAWG